MNFITTHNSSTTWPPFFFPKKSWPLERQQDFERNVGGQTHNSFTPIGTRLENLILPVCFPTKGSHRTRNQEERREASLF